MANDITIGKEYYNHCYNRPNTGGKTVTLETGGTCTLMAQEGLQIPALDGSEVAVFDVSMEISGMSSPLKKV